MASPLPNPTDAVHSQSQIPPGRISDYIQVVSPSQVPHSVQHPVGQVEISTSAAEPLAHPAEHPLLSSVRGREEKLRLPLSDQQPRATLHPPIPQGIPIRQYRRGNPTEIPGSVAQEATSMQFIGMTPEYMKGMRPHLYGQEGRGFDIRNAPKPPTAPDPHHSSNLDPWWCKSWTIWAIFGLVLFVVIGSTAGLAAGIRALF